MVVAVGVTVEVRPVGEVSNGNVEVCTAGGASRRRGGPLGARGGTSPRSSSTTLARGLWLGRRTEARPQSVTEVEGGRTRYRV